MRNIRLETWEKFWEARSAGEFIWGISPEFNPWLKIVALCTDDDMDDHPVAETLNQIFRDFDAPSHWVALSNDSLIDGVLQITGEVDEAKLEFNCDTASPGQFYVEGLIPAKGSVESPAKLVSLGVAIVQTALDLKKVQRAILRGELVWYVPGRHAKREIKGSIEYVLEFGNGIN